jgi:hypothetical protein
MRSPLAHLWIRQLQRLLLRGTRLASLLWNNFKLESLHHVCNAVCCVLTCEDDSCRGQCRVATEWHLHPWREPAQLEQRCSFEVVRASCSGVNLRCMDQVRDSVRVSAVGLSTGPTAVASAGLSELSDAWCVSSCSLQNGAMRSQPCRRCCFSCCNSPPPCVSAGTARQCCCFWQCVTAASAAPLTGSMKAVSTG